MSPNRPRRSRVYALLAVAASTLPLPTLAQTWIAGSGNWSTSSNWNPAAVPGARGNVVFSNTDAQARTLTYDYTGAAVTLLTLVVEQAGTGTNTLAINANTLTVTEMHVGEWGRGVVTQSGGNVTVGSGWLALAYYGTGSGVYRLTGGTLTTSNTIVAKGYGTFIHSGGTHTVSGLLGIGASADYPYGYDLSGSAKLVTKDVRIAGAPGFSSLFQQRGGTATVSGTLTLSGGTNATYLLTAGSLSAANTVNGGQFTQTGGTASFGTVSGIGQMNVSNAGSLTATAIRQASLTLESGANVSITPGGGTNGTSKLSQLSLAPDARFDLSDHALVLDYTGTSPIGSIRAAVAAGTLTSTLASPSAVLGYAEASRVLSPTGGTFAGQSADGTALLVRLTRLGDANLDGAVTFDDLLHVARNYNAPATDWQDGDFTRDGKVNFDDLLALARNYGATAPADPPPGASAAFTGDLASAFAAVPEPSTATLGLAACGFALIARRRRPNPASL